MRISDVHTIQSVLRNAIHSHLGKVVQLVISVDVYDAIHEALDCPDDCQVTDFMGIPISVHMSMPGFAFTVLRETENVHG
jgi:hypothetical protein